MRSSVAAIGLCFAFSAAADTFVVTNSSDSGTGSLRWAIEQSNATPGRDTILWNDAKTIVLQSPLPSVTDAVTIGIDPMPYWPDTIARPPVLTIDGSQTSGNGLRISGDGVVISSVVVVHFRSGDGIVVDGNDSILNWIEVSEAVDGVRLRGMRAGVYGSQLHDNQDAGLVIDSLSRDNAIGRSGYGCLPTGDPCDGTPTGNVFRANGTGMRVDGEHNAFIFTEAIGNRLDGAVINGAGNPLDSVFATGNGRNGATLLAAATPPVVVSCNGAMPFEVGAQVRLDAPRITAATRYTTLMTLSGDAHGAQNRTLLVAVYTIAPSPVDCGVYLGQVGVAHGTTTDAAGNAHFDVNVPGARGEALYAAVTELDEDGTAVATSELSAPFTPVTNTEPFADLSLEMTAPASVIFGQEMRIEIRVTNHGPGASTAYDLRFPLSGGIEYIDKTCGDATIAVCEEPPLAPGQTAVIEQRVRVIGRGTVLPYIAQVSGFALNDPNPANNTASVTVSITPAPQRRRSVLH